MGNIISNCCSNSLIYNIKNYFCGPSKSIYSRVNSYRRHYKRVNFARGEIFLPFDEKSPPIFYA